MSKAYTPVGSRSIFPLLAHRPIYVLRGRLDSTSGTFCLSLMTRGKTQRTPPSTLVFPYTMALQYCAPPESPRFLPSLSPVSTVFAQTSSPDSPFL